MSCAYRGDTMCHVHTVVIQCVMSIQGMIQCVMSIQGVIQCVMCIQG